MICLLGLDTLDDLNNPVSIKHFILEEYLSGPDGADPSLAEMMVLISQRGQLGALCRGGFLVELCCLCPLLNS